MKKIFPWIPFIFLPFSILAQQSFTPSDFHGIITLEENQTIHFSSLNNSSDGTNIAFYSQKPDKTQYQKQEGRRLLSFSRIVKIEIIELPEEEAAKLRTICGSETLRKATLTLKTPDHTIPEVVYLDFKWLEWRSDVMKGFPDTYRIELRNVDKIEFLQ